MMCGETIGEDKECAGYPEFPDVQGVSQSSPQLL